MIGLVSFPALLMLIFLRVPIGLAMFLTGLVGLVVVTGDTVIPFARLKSETYTTFSNYSLSIVPMFLLMGHFATLGGMSQALFKAAEGWLGHRKGGVAMAAVGACAGFGASSLKSCVDLALSVMQGAPKRIPNRIFHHLRSISNDRSIKID